MTVTARRRSDGYQFIYNEVVSTEFCRANVSMTLSLAAFDVVVEGK